MVCSVYVYCYARRNTNELWYKYRENKFGAAGLGGTYRVFGDTFANLVTSKNKKYKMEVKTTAGSAANLRLLSDGYIQMAVAQTDLTNDAYERTVFLRMKSSMEVTVQLLHCIQKRVRLL